MDYRSLLRHRRSAGVGLRQERVAALCVGAQTLVLPLDLAKSDDFHVLTAEVLARFGRLDVVVHNGGISQRSLVKDTAMEVH